MTPLVQNNLAPIARLCTAHHVRRLFLVGSAATAEFDPSRSDVDFLVEFAPRDRAGFDDVYFGLLADLESLLGRKVDLIEAGNLRNPYLIASINRTKRVLYAA